MEMTRDELERQVLTLSRRKDLPPFDAGALADHILSEIHSAPDLSVTARGMLMGAAAILMRHQYEETSAAERAEQLLSQVRRPS